MKISFLIGAALLVTTVARAQTNTSVVSQTGNMQSATAVQAGSYNESTIRQLTLSSATANVGNVASTSQTGSGTSLTNRVVVDQSNGAFSNTATVSQTYSGLAGATENTATVFQGKDASRNMVMVKQEKNSNIADVQQRDQSTDNAATVMQLGTSGNATLLQASQSGNNQATLTQTATSSGNFGDIFQATESYYNRAILEQAGVGGGALITQSVESANNDALIKQGAGGTNNLAAITQTNAYDGASAGASTVLGAANSATITQNQTTASSNGNFANIQQGTFDSTTPAGAVVSTGNKASVGQENDVNVTDLLQVGTGNTATIKQNGHSTLKGVDDPASAPFTNDVAGQFGNMNTLNVTQTGSMANQNIGNVTQIGNGNVSTISQVAPVAMP